MSGVVTTIKEKCRRCYTCVRECPARAIRVVNGQAEVIEERCIACGNCVKVCKQNAKKVLSHKDIVFEMINSDKQVFACFAPSFPAAFDKLKPGQIPAAAKAVGFDEVWEVALGAALVSTAYKKHLAKSDGKLMITTACPAIVGYVQKYLPELTPCLAPIVSPMVALARIIRDRYGEAARIVFIGPCIAKKVEMNEAEVIGCVNAVLSFKEFRDMLEDVGIQPGKLCSIDFDGPDAGIARSFPVSGGLLKSAGLKQDILDKDIIVSEGKDRVIPLLHAARDNEVEAKLLDVLFCEGCISGPKMLNNLSNFRRRELIADYVQWGAERAKNNNREDGSKVFAHIDMSREFKSDNKILPYPSEKEIVKVLQQMKKFSPEDELDCGACGYQTCREKAVAVCQNLAEPQMCLPYLVEGLEEALGDLEDSHRRLKNAQDQLVHAEKLASVGQLSAGVAHELNNPLGSILLYAHLLLKQVGEDKENAQDISVIVAEATRCKNIVKDLLNFSRQGSVKRERIDINALIVKTLAASGAISGFDSIMVVKDFDPKIPSIDIDSGQIQQVMANLLDNAVWAMKDSSEKTLTIKTDLKDPQTLQISMRDTGCGIPAENLKKLFTPFFTTKKMGEGTGLGLAISYGIIKMHSGQIVAQSNVDKGTTFKIELPLNAPDKTAQPVTWKDI